MFNLYVSPFGGACVIRNGDEDRILGASCYPWKCILSNVSRSTAIDAERLFIIGFDTGKQSTIIG